MEKKPALDLGGDRRDFLIRKVPGLLALLAGLPAIAGEAKPDKTPDQPKLSEQEQERVELIQDFRRKTLQFDALALMERVFSSFGIPPHYFAQFKKMSKKHDMGMGLTSIRKIFDCGEPNCDPRLELRDKKFRDPHVQNRIYRKTEMVGLVKGDKPQDYEEMRRKLVESIVVNTLGIDLTRLREHVSKYKDKDMAIFYGPVTNIPEFLGTILHEPFALYLQTVYGRKATEFFSESHPQSMEKLKEILLDPEYQFLALVSHGSWNSFSMSGVHISPDKGMKSAMQYWQNATEAYKKDPKKTLAGIFRIGIEDLLMKKKEGAVFTEEDLQKLIAQKCLTPADAEKVKKQMVTRYTCGHGRYEVDLASAYALNGPGISPSLREKMSFDVRRDLLNIDEEGLCNTPECFDTWTLSKMGGGTLVSASRPEYVESYETELSDFIRRRRGKIQVLNGFGTSLVRDGKNARGFEGTAWLDDYIRDPLTDHPPYDFDKK